MSNDWLTANDAGGAPYESGGSKMTVAQVTTVAKAQTSVKPPAESKDFRARLEALYIEALNRAALRKVAGTTEAWKRFESELSWLRNAYDSALAHAAADDAKAKAAVEGACKGPCLDKTPPLIEELKPSLPTQLEERPGMCRSLDMMFLRGEAKGRCMYREHHGSSCDANIRPNRVTGQAPSPT